MFLVAVAVFNWAIWPRFSVAIWADPRAWSGPVGHSSPTAFLLVHAVLVLTAVVLGTIVGVLGIRGRLALRTPGRLGRADRRSTAPVSLDRSSQGSGS